MTAATSSRQSPIIEIDESGAALTLQSPAPKLRKGARSKYITEEHPILGGKAKVVRNRHCGDTYHCFFPVPEEQRWYRRSLRTRDLNEALAKGADLYITVRAQLLSGAKVFPKKFEEIVDEFLKTKIEEAEAGLITSERVDTIRTCLTKWAIPFAEGRAMDAIPGEDWKRYFVWRRKQRSEVRDCTLINERAMIGALFKYADQKRYIAPRNIPVWDKALSKNKNVDRRDAFTRDEYETMHKMFRALVAEPTSEAERLQRRFLSDFFVIACNTGMRFGEMRKLRWHQVRTFKQPGDTGKPIQLCEIHLKREDTKNRKERVVQGLRGDVFDRIRRYSKQTGADDFVFVDNETGEQLAREVYYDGWALAKARAGLGERKKLTWYSCRHTYATFRLLYSRDLDVFTLAKNMGTSVKFIEDHYGHLETAQKRTELVSKKSPAW